VGRIGLVGLDGDDTLWHSERYFAEVQHRLTELLAPWADRTRLDERLVATERANLDVFGYGVKGFVLSMIETAIELSDGAVPASAIHRIIGWGKEMLAHPVELLDDVAEVVPELARRYRLVLVTKGDLFHQEAKIASSGLAEHFEGIEIVSEKAPEDYRRIARRYGVEPDRMVMVGNSLRSDVLPVAELGGRGVYVPYAVTWTLEHAELPEALADAVERIERLGQLPGVLARLD
jgi:putative hydrolase of the HAD superfamily